MNKLDFISRSPHVLIFGINSSKTNFGGIFTLIYLIIVLLISFAYLFDYAINSNYSFIYSKERKYMTEDEMNERKFDENLNPTIRYNIRMTNINESNFFVLNMKGKNIGRIFELGENLENKIDDVFFALFYKCLETEDNNCTIREEDQVNFNLYNIIINYTGFKIEHQNGDTPIVKDIVYDLYRITLNDKLFFSNLYWKIIKYTEEKGFLGAIEKLFGKNEVFYGGEFTNEIIYVDKFDYFKEIERRTKSKIFGVFQVITDNETLFDTYIRKKIGIFDYISNICSLSLTIYNITAFLFCGYYSNSFDNYKIIDNILLKNQKYFPKENEEEKGDNNLIELSGDFNKKENLIGINSINNEDNITLSQKGKEKKDENKFSNYGETNEKEKIISHQNTRILPKLHFYDFIFNNIYSKKCCLSKKQEIINSCNELVSEYFTIDNIIYNQMKLENLFKDYKWNNPELNTIGNNKLNYLFDNYE